VKPGKGSKVFILHRASMKEDLEKKNPNSRKHKTSSKFSITKLNNYFF